MTLLLTFTERILTNIEKLTSSIVLLEGNQALYNFLLYFLGFLISAALSFPFYIRGRISFGRFSILSIIFLFSYIPFVSENLNQVAFGFFLIGGFFITDYSIVYKSKNIFFKFIFLIEISVVLLLFLYNIKLQNNPEIRLEAVYNEEIFRKFLWYKINLILLHLVLSFIINTINIIFNGFPIKEEDGNIFWQKTIRKVLSYIFLNEKKIKLQFEELSQSYTLGIQDELRNFHTEFGPQSLDAFAMKVFLENRKEIVAQHNNHTFQINRIETRNKARELADKNHEGFKYFIEKYFKKSSFNQLHEGELDELYENKNEVIKLDQEIKDKRANEQIRLAHERIERERLIQQKLERERLEKQRLEKVKLEEERLAKVKLEEARKNLRESIEYQNEIRKNQEQERLNSELLEKQRLENEKTQRELAEKRRIEQERIERQRIEQRRQEQERIERQRIEQRRLEQERIEQEKLEVFYSIKRKVSGFESLTYSSTNPVKFFYF
jgi:hypothetical protein